jgi:ligand-binding sensor domain-containing protein
MSSNNNVEYIVEDKAGNIWFGAGGLCRYDGKSFICFTRKDGLLNNSVWSILEDRAGNLGWAQETPVCSVTMEKRLPLLQQMAIVFNTCP